jgi:hypothetical protein
MQSNSKITQPFITMENKILMVKLFLKKKINMIILESFNKSAAIF